MNKTIKLFCCAAILAISCYSFSAQAIDIAKIRAAAERGDAAAQYDLGVAYKEGRGVPKDDVEAVKWWKKAAEQGFAPAQYNLGKAYYDGIGGLPKDSVEAVKWDRKAAEQGHAQAEANLGWAYNIGMGGLPKDSAEGMRWWSKAAQDGDADAQNNLGIAYEKGIGVVKDSVQAYVWLTLAAAQGQKNALQGPDRVAVEKAITPEQVAQAKQLIQQWEQQHPNLFQGEK